MTIEIEHFSYRHALLNMSYVLEVSVRILRKENKKLLYYRLHDYSKVDICSFSVERKSIEFVDFFTHLGHVISSDLDDCRDVANRRGSFIGQTNSVLCDFGKIDSNVRCRLFRSCCGVNVNAMVRCYCYNLVSEDRKRIFEFLRELVSCGDWYGRCGECVLSRDEICVI